MDCGRLVERWREEISQRLDAELVAAGRLLSEKGALARLQVYPGRIDSTVSAEAIWRVALTTTPWSVPERHRLTVAKYQMTEEAWWIWLDSENLIRLPFWYGSSATGGCSCGEPDICAHRLAVTEAYLNRVAHDEHLFWGLLNRGHNTSGLSDRYYRGFRVPPEFGQGAERTHDEIIRVIDGVRAAANAAMDPNGTSS